MNRTTTLQDLLSKFRESMAAQIHTALPGKIVRYDSSAQKADVQPLIKDRYTDRSGSASGPNLASNPSSPGAVSGGWRVSDHVSRCGG